MKPEERFRHAVEVVLRHEGGYVYDPRDPGGETMYGISKRSYPHLDIANLTRDQAVEIYRRDWWERYGYGELASLEVATKVFDLAVNTGPGTAHRLLQEALVFLGHQLVVDGVLGPKTLAAANAEEPQRLLQVLRWKAAERYFSLAERRPENRAFLLGWLRRAYS